MVQYAGWVVDGQIRPAAQPEISQRQQATAVINGRWGFGQPTARRAVDVLSEIAQASGVAAVTIRDCNHSGRLGEYVGALAEQAVADAGRRAPARPSARRAGAAWGGS